MSRQASAEPSEKQLEVLRYLISFIEENGFQPTQGEMAEHFGVTPTAIQQRVKELGRRGFLKWPEDGRVRERALILNHVKFRAFFAKDKED